MYNFKGDWVEFSKRLKDLREKQGISSKKMAEELGVSLSTYRDWEYGRKIMGEPYLKIASILGVSLNELFGNEARNYKEMKDAIDQVKITLKKLEDVCESFF